MSSDSTSSTYKDLRLHRQWASEGPNKRSLQILIVGGCFHVISRENVPMILFVRMKKQDDIPNVAKCFKEEAVEDNDDHDNDVAL